MPTDDETDAGTVEAASGLGAWVRTSVGDGGVRFDRLALWVVALGLFAVVAFVAWRYVGTVVLGLFVYYVTRPVFVRIHERIESRTVAVVVTLLTVALPVLVLVGWTLSIAIQGLADLLAAGTLGQLEALIAPFVDLSAVVGDVNGVVDDLLRDPTQLAGLNLGPFASEVAAVVVSSLGVLVNVGIHGFIVLIITFYLLRDDYRLADWARRTFVRDDGPLEAYLLAVDRDLKNVYFGNILNALVTGLLAAVTYVLLNAVAPQGVAIPQPGLVGLLVGAGSLVPVIGIKIVWVPVGLYLAGRAAMTSPEALWFPAVFAVVSVVVVDYIPDQLLRPYVSGRTLHVGAVMLAYTLGPLLFGWYGIFLGPLVLVVVFEFGRIVVPWLFDPRFDADEAGAVEPATTESAEAGPAGAEAETAGGDAPPSAADAAADEAEPSGRPEESPEGDGSPASDGGATRASDRHGSSAGGEEGPTEPDDEGAQEPDGSPTGDGT